MTPVCLCCGFVLQGPGAAQRTGRSETWTYHRFGKAGWWGAESWLVMSSAGLWPEQQANRSAITAPYQFALKTRTGCECVSHTFRILAEMDEATDGSCQLTGSFRGGPPRQQNVSLGGAGVDLPECQERPRGKHKKVVFFSWCLLLCCAAAWANFWFADSSELSGDFAPEHDASLWRCMCQLLHLDPAIIDVPPRRPLLFPLAREGWVCVQPSDSATQSSGPVGPT